MGIDHIEELKPPPYKKLSPEDLKPDPRVVHNSQTCGGQGICLTCSVRAYLESREER